MKKYILIMLVFFWAIPSGFAQLKLHSFEEVTQLAKANPKPIVVFIHTSWCTYCKIMQNSSFKNPDVIKKLNDEFYFIALDSESKKEIMFNNHLFRFKPTGPNTGVHELATALATINNQIVYPTLTILEKDNTIVFQQHSFIDDKALLRILDELK